MKRPPPPSVRRAKRKSQEERQSAERAAVEQREAAARAEEQRYHADLMAMAHAKVGGTCMVIVARPAAEGPSQTCGKPAIARDGIMRLCEKHAAAWGLEVSFVSDGRQRAMQRQIGLNQGSN